MLQRNLTVIVVVVVAVSSSALAGCEGQTYTKGEGTELARVTSPNEQLNAVLMRYVYGGAVGGGVDSNVYIVRKGAPVVPKPRSEILRADPMSGGALVWKRDHLLQVQYEKIFFRS